MEVCPPPQRPDERAVSGLYAAIRGVFATSLAAVVLGVAFVAAIPAAGADWVNECAATTGQTGSWSEGFAYDPAAQTADICGDAVFTPNTVSAGNFVTLKFTTTLYRQLKDDAPDADTQGALCIGTNGCFQVWTRLRQGAGWLDVFAVGITPVPGAEYGISFVFDYAGGKYSVSVKDAKSVWSHEMRKETAELQGLQGALATEANRAALAALGLDKIAAALFAANDAARAAMEARSDERSERAEEKASGTTPELRKAVAALLVQAARRVNAVNEVAPTEATAAAISKVAALVEEYKLVASQFKGKKKTDPEPEPEPTPEASAS